VKHLTPSARRLLGMAFATVVGTAVLAVAAPASAASTTEHLTLGHSALCLPNGQREVTWTVTSSRPASSTLSVVDLTSNPAGFGFVDGTIIKVGATLPASPGQLVDKQLLPGNAIGASLHVETVFTSSDVKTTVPGDDQIAFDGTCTPAYTVTQDCHGITFTFKAPPVGTTVISILVTLHPSVGSDQSFTIKSGDPDKTVTIPGSPGLKVDLSYGGNFKTTYTWSHDPCPSPTLPITGSHLTGVIGIGAGLVGGGVGLIVLMLVLRRRRTVSGT
jgi:hypothetical protein